MSSHSSTLAPGLSPTTTWGPAQAALEAEWRALGLVRPVGMPARHAWGGIVRWAAQDPDARPLRFAPARAHSGPKLACTDPATRRTVLAWVEARIARTGHAFVPLSASDGDGNWRDDPGTGEQRDHSPSERVAGLASWVQATLIERGHSTRVTMLAYGATTPPPTRVHPDVAVVVAGPAYQPPGWTVPRAVAAWRLAGAQTVQPYVYWTSWYRGEPGRAWLLVPERVVEALSWPRHGVPDAMHGAIQAGWWASLQPSVAALAQALRAPDPVTVDRFVAWRDTAIRERWGSIEAPVARWYAGQHRTVPVTDRWLHEQYACCLEALKACRAPEQAHALCGLVQHTRHVELWDRWRSTGGQREVPAWAAVVEWMWSVAHRPVLDTRALARALKVRQGKPPEGWVSDPSVDDPDAMAALCERRIDAMAVQTRPVIPVRDPTGWKPPEARGRRRGSLGTGWRPDLRGAGAWWVGGDGVGRVELDLQRGGKAAGSAFPVELVLGGAAVHRAEVPGDGTLARLVHHGPPDAVYTLRWPEGSHRQPVRITAAPGRRLAYRPDADACTHATVGRLRVWVRVRAGASHVGLFGSRSLRLWAPGVDPGRLWKTGFHFEGTVAGEHRIAVDHSWSGQWVAVSAHHVVPMSGAEPYLVRRPDEGPTT